ncbi:hypothetical protein B0H13DRAFT_2375589 [Mycena leptocephala]|nr:hypothetical protein B0H13DRAFT_2375589 [Mycena leptocephala]
MWVIVGIARFWCVPFPASLFSFCHPLPFHSPLPSYLSTPASTRVLRSRPRVHRPAPQATRTRLAAPSVLPHHDAASLTPYHTHTPRTPRAHHNPLTPTHTRAPRHLCPLPAHRARVLRNASPPLEARARRVPPTYDPRPQVHAQCLRWCSLVLGARSFIRSPGPASIIAPVPPSLLDLCTWAIPPRPLPPPVSAAHADSVPLAHVAFSASRNCDLSISATIDAHTAHAPGITTPVGCSGRGTRSSLRTSPPSPPEAIHLRGGPTHARSKMPCSLAIGCHAPRETRTRCIVLSLAARRSSGCLARMDTRTRARRTMEWILRDPSGGDVFVPLFSFVSQSSVLSEARRRVKKV